VRCAIKPDNDKSNNNKNILNSHTLTKHYRMSYVLGGLFLNESLIVAGEYTNQKDWDKTKSQILTENRLQTNMKKSSVRMYREIELRLKTLTDNQLNLLYSGAVEEKRQILWLTCCKSYRLIFEMATELFEEKAARGERQLALSDYEAFYTKKALKSDKLQYLTQSTRDKLRSVTFKIMREADIISKNNEILPQLVSRQVKTAIAEENPKLLKIYP